jgi:hypothetical protein
MFYRGVILFSICVLISCTKTIDIDLPDHDSKLVINSLFTHGERIAVNISRSTSILGGVPPGVFNAGIKLYRNGELVETVTSSDSIYIAAFGPVENVVYAVEVSAPGFESVTATDSMPSKTSLNYAFSTDEIWIDEIGMKHKLLKLGFSDSDPNKNYYELKLKVRFLSRNYPSHDYTYVTKLANIGGVIGPILKDAEQNYVLIKGFIFDDSKFNNADCNLEIFAGIMNNESDEYELIVELNSVSENYYNYKKQLGTYLKKEDGDIFEGIPDPVNLFSNIENGYGIFAGYISDRVVINISDK